MWTRMMLVALVAVGCSSSSRTAAAPPVVAETPPTTSDPGAVQDRAALPPVPVQPETGRGSAGSSSGGSLGTGSDGAACLTADDCASGICEGPGCGPETPGRCVPRTRACTRDLRTYCGCDGKPFEASGRCPGKRYSQRAACGS